MKHRIHVSTRVYRMIQEERSVFWEGIISVIAGEKKLSMNMCLDSDWLPRLELFESTATKVL